MLFLSILSFPSLLPRLVFFDLTPLRRHGPRKKEGMAQEIARQEREVVGQCHQVLERQQGELGSEKAIPFGD